MARFLITVWSFETHLEPNFAVADALTKAGHEVAFYCGFRGAREAVALGFQAFPFHSLSEEVADRNVAGILESRKRPWKTGKYWSNFLVSQMTNQVEDLQAILRDWHPDVLIADMTMLAPFTILHELEKVPVAVLSHVGYCMYPGLEGPVAGRAMPPRRTARERLRAWIIAALANYVTREVPRGIDRMRRRYGLDPLRLRVVEYHGTVPLLLIPTVPELDYKRRDLPPVVHYVGMCPWPPAKPVAVERGARDQVIVEEGSLYTSEPTLLRVAAQALNGLDCDVRIIAGKGRAGKGGDLAALQIGALGPRVTVETWRPLNQVLSRAKLVVSTGNTESVLTALGCNVPVVVAPSILDQAEIGMRVQEFGAGVSLPAALCKASALRSAVQRVLGDASFSRQATLAGALLSTHDGPAEAVQHLERLIPRRNSAPAPRRGAKDAVNRAVTRT